MIKTQEQYHSSQFCPKCNQPTLKHTFEIIGQGDEYDVTVHSVSCPCGYGDCDVY